MKKRKGNLRALCLRHWTVAQCVLCGREGSGIDAHHLDGDSDNSAPDNLAWACATCHRGEIHRLAIPVAILKQLRRLREDHGSGAAPEVLKMRSEHARKAHEARGPKGQQSLLDRLK
jgi:hypothetical protein